MVLGLTLRRRTHFAQLFKEKGVQGANGSIVSAPKDGNNPGRRRVTQDMYLVTTAANAKMSISLSRKDRKCYENFRIQSLELLGLESVVALVNV